MDKKKKKLVRLFVAIAVSSLKIFNKEFLKTQNSNKKKKENFHEEKHCQDHNQDFHYPGGDYR